MFLPRLNDAFCTYQFQVEQAIYGLEVLTLTIQILLMIFIQWIKSGLIVNIGVFS